MARVSELPEAEKPISEKFRVAAKKWAQADSAAHIMEEMKTTTLEQMKTKLIAANAGMAENKAERLVKASKEWEAYIRKMCSFRSSANFLRQEVEYQRMRHREWVGANADARAEQRLSTGHA